MIHADNLSAESRVRHAFFTRRGGVSEGVYASLNCGFGSGDDHARVRANRTAAMQTLNADPDELTTVHQIHSADVVKVEEPWPLMHRPKADGMVTDRPGVALGIMTADCAPVLFADTDAGVVGAAHAGWRGALAGVLQATLEAMETLGAARSQVAAALGPCIRKSSYEVGPEFRATFLETDPAHRSYFEPAVRDGHFMFDLAGFIVDGLWSLGVASVDDVNVDTYVDADRFFSYRRTTHRGESDYGRGLSVVMMGEN